MAMGYYPGCSLEGTAAEYDFSIRETAKRLGIELKEIDDWNCCGASAGHQTNHTLGIALPGRILNLAAAQKVEEVLAPCAACSNRLIAAQKSWLEDEKVRREVEEVLEKPLPANEIKVVNCIEFYLPFLEQIKEKVAKNLGDKKVACYYGCLLLRPPKILSFDDPENPQSMEKIVESLGAVPIEWAFKSECCGAGFAMSETPAVIRLVEKILRNVHDEGADIVVTACPLCHANLDMRQSTGRLGFQMPILYLSQIVGLALGISPQLLGMNKHITPVASALP